MKSVCICGTIQHRNDIVLKLSQEYQIKCYLEHRNIYDKKYFDYKDVYTYEEYGYDAIDYYIIAYEKKEMIDETLEVLKEHNVSRDKVVVYNDFFDTLQLDVLKRYAHENKTFDNIVLGMSHAKSDIKLSMCFDNTFSFAGPSMDLFCHREILRYLNKNYPQQMRMLKNVIIELPYYTFNYDLSSFKKFFLTKMFYFYSFNNYHNYTNCEYINEFSQFEKMFLQNMRSQPYIADENTEYDINTKFVPLKKKIYHLVDMLKVIQNHDKVWEANFDSTKHENIVIFKEIIDLIKEKNPHIKIIIVIAPFNPLFRISHKKTILQKKKEFYNYIKYVEDSVDVVDLFESINSSKYFLDHCHLNKAGAIKWTQILCENIKKILNY